MRPIIHGWSLRAVPLYGDITRGLASVRNARPVGRRPLSPLDLEYRSTTCARCASRFVDTLRKDSEAWSTQELAREGFKEMGCDVF